MEPRPDGIRHQFESPRPDTGSTDSDGPITAVLFNDPGCPFGYSASPALRTLEWRYRDQIEWHLVTIGLSDPEHPSPFSPLEQATGWIDFRDRHGMPFSAEPKRRLPTTARACQVITASRLLHPGSEWRVLRTLQLLNFTTPLLLDEDDDLKAALLTIPGIDAERVFDTIDSAAVQDAYRADWTRARQAAGGAAEMQGRTADSPLGARFTAPSVIFTLAGRSIQVGGFQPVEAYDVAVANLDPSMNRVPPAEGPADALRLYPAGLTTREVSQVCADGVPDHQGTERELLELTDAGKVRRVPLGQDALWLSR